MKSKLFSRFNLGDDRNRSFSNDLRTFIGLDEKTTDILVSNIIGFSSLRYTYERNQFSEKLSKDNGIDLSIIKNSLSVLDFLQSKIVDTNFQGDTIELWISDLKEQNLLDDTNIQKFTISITKLWTNATEKYLEISRKQRYMSRVFPSLKSMDHSVELRGVFKDEYLITKSCVSIATLHSEGFLQGRSYERSVEAFAIVEGRQGQSS